MTKEERETIINFNDADDTADVYSCQSFVWTRLHKLGFTPYDTIKNARGTVISKSYTIPANFVLLRRPKRMSQAFRDSAKARGFVGRKC